MSSQPFLCATLAVATLIFLFSGQSVTAEGESNAARESGRLDSAPEECDGVLSLAGAVALALARNPRLAAFSWEVRAAEARAVQARLRPNPELSVEVEGVRWRRGGRTVTEGLTAGLGFPPSGGRFEVERDVEERAPSGFAEAELTVRLSQVVELGGKRAKRLRLAQRDQDVAAWDYEVARADVLTRVAKAFLEVLAAQERRRLREELARLAERLGETVSARVEAGEVSPLELNKVRIELSAAQIEAQRALRQLEAARVQLAAQWGSTAPVFGRAVGRLECLCPLPPIEELEQQTAANPDLARWSAEMDRRRAAVTVEQSRKVPDLTVTLGYRAENLTSGGSKGAVLSTGEGFALTRDRTRFDDDRDQSLVLEFSLPLPLFNRNQGSILEAEHLMSKASEESRATTVNVRATLSGWYRQAEAARDEVATLEGTMLPDAKETFNLTEEGYRAGKFGYLDVLDAERTLFELGVQHIEARVAHHVAHIEMERLVGASLCAESDADQSAVNTDEAGRASAAE